jgi:pyruvate dehydrogenase E2 component (dihydrolipoamide acetyltransferase)
MAFEFRLPDIGEGVVEGEIVRWLVQAGDQVVEDQPLVEVMTDKATIEIPSPVAGKVQKCHGDEGDIVDVGAILIVIEADAKTDVSETVEPEPVKKAPKRAKTASAEEPAAATGPVLATPAVRKMAQEMKIDLAELPGSGPKGRITAEDVQKFSQDQQVSITDRPQPPVETIPYRGLRRKIGEHLSTSKQTAAHYTYVEEVDVTELVQLRQKFLDRETEDARPTYLPFIMKAVVAGLKRFPLLNAELDEKKGEVLLKKEYHIGVATATEEGLVVPVVRDVDKKNLRELTREIDSLAESARKGRLTREDLQGGTFTITSLGALGGVMATPIINYPEVAILGVHKVAKRPVVQGNQIEVRDMMNLSISLDHRVVDGVIAAEFMQHIIGFLQAPGLLLLEGQ